MATTIAVATPATANAPEGTRPTISSTSRSSFSWDMVAGSVTKLPSFGQQLAQLVGLRRRHGRAAVAPGDTDVRDHRRDFVVVEDVVERRHAVRASVLP